METNRQIVELVLEVLQAHPEIQCAYIYGSALGGKLQPDSDVDVAVAGERPLTVRAKASLREKMEMAVRRDVDLVDLHRAAGTILREAMRGECIMCRDTRVKYQLMRRLVYDQEDLQPLRRQMMDRRREAFVHGC